MHVGRLSPSEQKGLTSREEPIVWGSSHMLLEQPGTIAVATVTTYGGTAVCVPAPCCPRRRTGPCSSGGGGRGVSDSLGERQRWELTGALGARCCVVCCAPCGSSGRVLSVSPSVSLSPTHSGVPLPRPQAPTALTSFLPPIPPRPCPPPGLSSGYHCSLCL